MSYITSNSKSFNLNLDVLNMFRQEYKNDKTIQNLIKDSTDHV